MFIECAQPLDCGGLCPVALPASPPMLDIQTT